MEEIFMSNHVEELRKKYIKNPPEGMTAKDVKMMSDDYLLDMDYFLNETEEDIFNGADDIMFFNF